MANETARPEGILAPTPDQRWALKHPPGDRTLLHAELEKRTTEERASFVDERGREPSDAEQLAIARIAICRTLVACGHLQFRRRRFSLRV